MLELYIIPLLIVRGLKPTSNTLHKMGIGRSAARQLIQGTAASITLITLAKLCKGLKCTPNDIINYHPNIKLSNPDEPLHKLIKEPLDFNALTLIQCMTHEEIEQFTKRIKHGE